MKHRLFGHLSASTSAWLLMAVLAWPASAVAQDEEPIPYPGDEETTPRRKNGLRQLPADSGEDPLRKYTDVEVDEDERLASYDDPLKGLGLEALAGIMFLDSSSGKWADVRPALGLRYVWEFGRTIGGEWMRERLFADVTWLRTSLSGGTTQVESRLGIHTFTIAPALNFPLDRNNVFNAYVQAGAGLAYQSSELVVEGRSFGVSALKPMFRYGGGLRFRLFPTRGMRLVLRAELTGLRRDYFNDLFLGTSAGFAF